MYNKTFKQGVVLEQTILNVIREYGEDNIRVATVTLRGQHRITYVGKKLKILLGQLKNHFRGIITVTALKEQSTHVHLLLVLKAQSPSDNELKRIFKAAKSKAKFAFVHDFNPIRQTPEAVACYFKNNYYEVMDYRQYSRNNLKGRVTRTVRVPMYLKLRPEG